MTKTIPMNAKRRSSTPANLPVWDLYVGSCAEPYGLLTNFAGEGAVATVQSILDSTNEARFSAKTIADVCAQVRAFWESEFEHMNAEKEVAEAEAERQTELGIERYYDGLIPMAEKMQAEREEFEAAMWRA